MVAIKAFFAGNTTNTVELEQRFPINFSGCLIRSIFAV